MRFATGALMIGLAGIALVQSVTILRFAVADWTATGKDARERVAPFAHASAVAALARARMIEFDAHGDAAPPLGDIYALLDETPLDGGAWLQLAQALQASGSPTERVLAAMAMSHVTGPNEGRLMAERALFGLQFWALGSDDARARLVADIRGGWLLLSEERRRVLRDRLKEADAETRAEVESKLSRASADGAAIAAALDLDALELRASQ